MHARYATLSADNFPTLPPSSIHRIWTNLKLHSEKHWGRHWIHHPFVRQRTRWKQNHSLIIQSKTQNIVLRMIYRVRIILHRRLASCLRSTRCRHSPHYPETWPKPGTSKPITNFYWSKSLLELKTQSHCEGFGHKQRQCFDYIRAIAPNL